MGYNFNNDEWKNEIAHAVSAFTRSVVAVVPLIAAAFALALFVHELFSEPFGLTCKSMAVDQKTAIYRKVAPVRVIPMGKVESKASSLVVEPVKPDTDKDQDKIEE